ncbi:RNA recognition motif. (a.k.a. RRM, RBD, or RNP domain) [Vibrio xiamenensis]|uniref:RNA recognition motif. (A.k.a. RRM, RBD, or RNP domain) n=1 Tax=Vibrio xiamenensis TaxID=861298 RepID=A0A1G8G4R1_9VIBR|nr:RNA-binding protein [Vibrio xiamenensis]SDH89418.1 RNA recognition motif. (a.k.a. RRM, RBD, or RNP domain) [Vibrio xiamenensis]
MSSNKSTLLIIALAVLGGIIFSQIVVSPAISYVVGVIITALLLKFVANSPLKDNQPAPSTKTLYVGNLPYKANESHVKDLFAQYGEVFAVRLMKDKRTGKRRGFGFVVMASADAQGAIDALNDNEYMQRTLKVRVANEPKKGESLESELD